VYDYVDGKLDWLAAGLPTEGTNAAHARARDVAIADVPTCGLGERIADVRERVRAAAWDGCVVVNGERIVLGVLRRRELERGGDDRVEDVMRPGPSTFRPHVSIQEMAAYLVDHDLAAAPITASDGRLLGMLRREDAVRVAHAEHDREHGGDEDE
jgi:Mg/Co/Ni transporter MgtE